MKNLLLYLVMLLMIMFFAVASILSVYLLGITFKYLFETWSRYVLYPAHLNDVIALFILSISFVSLLIFWLRQAIYKVLEI
jgi:hypothetical protein